MERIKVALIKGSEVKICTPVIAGKLLNVNPETIRRWYRDKKKVFRNGYDVYTDIEKLKS